MFSKKCFCKGNIPKINRPLLAALSVNGLTITNTGLEQHLPAHIETWLHGPWQLGEGEENYVALYHYWGRLHGMPFHLQRKNKTQGVLLVLRLKQLNTKFILQQKYAW